ncbi:MAG: glycosyltransferase [Bacilli bacterium]
MSTVSVIVPIYNSEKFLDKCINSIINQTYKNLQIILVNDGSYDNSGKYIEYYKKKDSRIKVINKENGGLWSARNAGLEIATGDYISFVDSDDWIEKDMIEKMYNSIVEYNSDLSVCNYGKVYENKTEKKSLKIEDNIIEINEIGIDNYFYNYYFNYLHGHEVTNKLYKNMIITEHQIRFDKNEDIFSEDLLFNLYYICHVNKISSLEQSLYNYVQHENSIMNNVKPNIIVRYGLLISKYITYTKKHGLFEELKAVIPVMLYNLLSKGIYLKYSSLTALDIAAKELSEALEIKYIKSNILNLAVGKPMRAFRKKFGIKIEAENRARIFAVYCYLGLYRLAIRQKYCRYKTE